MFCLLGESWRKKGYLSYILYSVYIFLELTGIVWPLWTDKHITICLWQSGAPFFKFSTDCSQYRGYILQCGGFIRNIIRLRIHAAHLWSTVTRIRILLSLVNFLTNEKIFTNKRIIFHSYLNSNNLIFDYTILVVPVTDIQNV